MYTHANKTQEKRNGSITNSFSQKKNGGKSTFQFADNRPSAIVQRKLQEMANNSLQVKQAKRSPEDISSNEVVQRIVAPSFAAKGARPLGTPIPTNAAGEWTRPRWLRGEDGAVQTMIGDLIAAGKVRRSTQNPAHIFDAYTGTWVSIIGVSIDHIVDWKQFAQENGVADLQGLENAYHEMDNLMLSGSRVNSGMVQTDALQWMASPAHERMLNLTGNPQGHERLGVLMDDLVSVDPDMTINHIPEDRRQEFLQHLGTIQNPREGATMTEPINPLRLMMAFRDARHIAGAEAPLPDIEDDSDTMEE